METLIALVIGRASSTLSVVLSDFLSLFFLRTLLVVFLSLLIQFSRIYGKATATKALSYLALSDLAVGGDGASRSVF